MRNTQTVKVALAGCGTVGSGVGEIIVSRAEALAQRTGLRFEVTRALVADIRRRRSAPFPADIYTDQPADLIAARPDMLVEVMGGATTARTVVLDALRSGIPVVTANKALLALHGAEVYRTARQAGTCVAFEASCAGGLPIIGALLHGLQANRTETLMGLFNSTCNFVLSSMLDGGMSYADAVGEAQRRGYAEADPTLDVSGGDTAHKLTILASLAFARNVEFSRIALTGIDRLQLTDLRIARELGYACKLLGIGQRIAAGNGQPERLFLAVSPTLITLGHPLAGLNGTASGMLTYGDAVGETFYSGTGAGSLPTASAVVADMIDVATGATQATFNRLGIFNDQTPPADYLPADDMERPAYVRFTFGPDAARAQADVENAWPAAGIPRRRIHLCHQHHAVLVFTDPVTPRRLIPAVRAVAGKLALAADPMVLPVLEDQPA